MLKDVSIRIDYSIRVNHSVGYFTITRKELISILNDDGGINIEKLNELYNSKYHLKLYIG